MTLIKRQTTTKVLDLIEPSSLLLQLESCSRLGNQGGQSGLHAGLIAIVETLKVDEARCHEESHIYLRRHILGKLLNGL